MAIAKLNAPHGGAYPPCSASLGKALQRNSVAMLTQPRTNSGAACLTGVPRLAPSGSTFRKLSGKVEFFFVPHSWQTIVVLRTRSLRSLVYCSRSRVLHRFALSTLSESSRLRSMVVTFLEKFSFCVFWRVSELLAICGVFIRVASLPPPVKGGSLTKLGYMVFFRSSFCSMPKPCKVVASPSTLSGRSISAPCGRFSFAFGHSTLCGAHHSRSFVLAVASFRPGLSVSLVPRDRFLSQPPPIQPRFVFVLARLSLARPAVMVFETKNTRQQSLTFASCFALLAKGLRSSRGRLADLTLKSPALLWLMSSLRSAHASVVYYGCFPRNSVCFRQNP